MRFISPKEAEKLLAVSRWTLWRLRRVGAFPKPVKVSPGRIAFMAEEVEEWIRDRLAHSGD